MECDSITTETTEPGTSCSQSGQTVVIADAGYEAWLVPWRHAEAPAIGVRFCFRGCAWEITRYRKHARAFVAEPAQH